MLGIVLTIVVATAAGVLSERRTGGGAQRLRHVVMRVMLWVLVPFVAYVNLARAHLSLDAILALVIALASVIAAGTTMGALGRGPLRLRDAGVGAAIVCTIQGNTSYFGFPLVAALFSRAQFSQAVAYDGLVSLPVFVLVSFSVGARFGDAGGAGIRAQLRTAIVRNPVLFAVIAALLVPQGWAPSALVEPAHLAVLSLLPLGFFVVGVTLGDEAKDGTLRVPPPLTPPIAAVAALKMAFVPLMLLLAGLILDVPAPFYVMAAMPVGVNTVLVGHATGLDLRLTSSSIAWTTSIALAAIAALTIARALS